MDQKKHSTFFTLNIIWIYAEIPKYKFPGSNLKGGGGGGSMSWV